MHPGPIIDPHHHLWDLSSGNHPWMVPESPTVQAVPGLDTIAPDYLVEDYIRDAAGHNVVASVHIEALWAGDPVDETRWLDTLSKTQGVALRYVAAASLGKPGASAIIKRQAAFERVFGIRGIVSCHPDVKKGFVSDPRLGYDPAWRSDVRNLYECGLNFELMMYPYQAQAVFDLAETFPNLQIVINHCGSPIDRDEEGMQRWRYGLRKIAAQPNVVLKISNPGGYDEVRTHETIGNVVRQCIESFETERTMFGTDYPVSRIQMTFDEIYDSFKRSVGDLSADEQRALFHDNAKRVYRL